MTDWRKRLDRIKGLKWNLEYKETRTLINWIRNHKFNFEYFKRKQDLLWNLQYFLVFSGCCSVTKSCPTLCDPMNCSTLFSLIFHYLPELAQTHVHWVGDAIPPSHPLLPPSPPALNLSQHQGLFQWIRVIISFWTTKHNWSPRQPFFADS